MDLIKFQFTKVYYPTKELLELIPISKATFYRMHREEIKAGRDGSDMGKVKIKGLENTLWCPVKFLEYLHKHKVLTQKIRYDYEKAEQDQVHNSIDVFYTNQKQLNKEIN
jgi:hypothetical protein|tara:strand:- start:630 stop:959 length:330 start_codon:yes stop_codon:yes gene_type:complete